MAERDDTRSPALTVRCEVCLRTLQKGSSGYVTYVVCHDCHDARRRRVERIREEVRRDPEGYAAARLPYVACRLAREVSRG